MAYKTFVVERTENAQTGTAGPATLHRNNEPPLVKVYDTVADVETDIANIDTNEIVGTKEVDLSSYTIVNRVADGNLNPVTSNAVANALSYSTDETPTGGYWIDGKPIYRRVYTGLSFGGINETWGNTGVTNAEIDTLVSAYALRASEVINIVNFRKDTGGVLKSYANLGYNPACDTLIIEYTKTTD